MTQVSPTSAPPFFATHEHRAIETALVRATAALPDNVRAVASHVLESGGKRLRPLLTVRVARLLGCADDAVYALAAAVEMAHAATLLHDDVLDKADLRRGRAAAHHLFGVVPTVLAGDALLAYANRTVASYGLGALSVAFSEAIARTAEGEILEIRNQGQAAPLETYLDIVRGKTAWMIRMACEVGAIFAGASEPRIAAAADYGFNLGIAFQIVDDALDFTPSARTGKPEGGDLREGKFTPPLLLYAQTLSPEAQRCFLRRFGAGHEASGYPAALAGFGGSVPLAEQGAEQRAEPPAQNGEAPFAEDELRALVQAVRHAGCDVRARDMASAYLDAARVALARLTQGLAPGSGQDELAAYIDQMRQRES